MPPAGLMLQRQDRVADVISHAVVIFLGSAGRSPGAGSAEGPCTLRQARSLESVIRPLWSLGTVSADPEVRRSNQPSLPPEDARQTSPRRCERRPAGQTRSRRGNRRRDRLARQYLPVAGQMRQIDRRGRRRRKGPRSGRSPGDGTGVFGLGRRDTESEGCRSGPGGGSRPRRRRGCHNPSPPVRYRAGRGSSPCRRHGGSGGRRRDILVQEVARRSLVRREDQVVDPVLGGEEAQRAAADFAGQLGSPAGDRRRSG